MPPRRHPNRRRAIAVGTVIVVVVALGAGVAIAMTRSTGHSYRTTTVTRSAVAQTLDSTGTIEAVSQAAVAFPTSGTVQTVDVTVGTPVTAGQTLATLENGPLVQALLQQKASLAQAQVNLQKAIDEQDDATSSSSTSAASSSSGGFSAGSSGGNHSSGSTGTTGGSSAGIAGLQRQLLAAQRMVDTELAQTEQSEHATANVCGAGTPPHGHGPTTTIPGPTTTIPGPTTTVAGTTTTVAGPTTTTTPGTSPGGPGSTACINAQEALLTAETSLAGAERTLGRDETMLSAMLTSSTRSGGSTETSSTGTSKSSSTASGASTSSIAARSNGVSSATHVPTAMDLVADQATIDADTAAVTSAFENLQQATLASPIAGVVGAVAIAPGSSVSAGSSSATITVIGAGGYEVATTVTVNDIASVKLGEPAQITADGSTTSVPGKVVYIGTADLTDTSATYPVVIGLTAQNADAGLRDGASASTSIQVGQASNSALTVPTSAVLNNNGRHTVEVLANGKLTTVTVQVGVIGPLRTQITSGLKAGETVVLADLHAALPTSNIANAVAGNGGGGGGGGGLLGGGGGGITGGGGGGRFRAGG
ncbi:MAG TPA: HlyD family efflux transporter periplasmic adaptor subunit [Acidimicrobiia bacterium]